LNKSAPHSRVAPERHHRSFPTASKAIDTLVALGIAREITAGRRHRLFAYDADLAFLSEGKEPL
jgi:hypothetical protein